MLNKTIDNFINVTTNPMLLIEYKTLATTQTVTHAHPQQKRISTQDSEINKAAITLEIYTKNTSANKTNNNVKINLTLIYIQRGN